MRLQTCREGRKAVVRVGGRGAALQEAVCDEQHVLTRCLERLRRYVENMEDASCCLPHGEGPMLLGISSCRALDSNSRFTHRRVCHVSPVRLCLVRAARCVVRLLVCEQLLHFLVDVVVADILIHCYGLLFLPHAICGRGVPLLVEAGHGRLAERSRALNVERRILERLQ